MNSYSNQKDTQAATTAAASVQKKSAGTQDVQHVDNRPEAAAHAALQNKIDNSTRVNQFAKIVPQGLAGEVAQLNGKKKGEEGNKKGEGGKKKGDDYCNNISKLVRAIGDSFDDSSNESLDEFLNKAITDQLSIIDTNRPQCSVSSDLLTGTDTNTAAYGEFAAEVKKIIGVLSLLKLDSSKSHVRKGIQSNWGPLKTLLESIPATCVDSRVGDVITAGTEGNAAAMNAINAALKALRDALIARLKVYLQDMYDAIPVKKKDDDKDKGDGGAGAEVGGAPGGGGLVEAH
ncbi:hypothetical protein ACX0HA_00420 [Flavobacterium hauense]